MSTTEKSLGEFLDQEIEPRETFVIDDEAKAVWALRKIAKLTGEIDKHIEVAEAEIQRIGEWLDAVNKPNKEAIEYFTSLLEGYHRKIFAADEKKKTIKLPHGELKLRAQEPEYVRNDEALLQFLQENKWPYIKVKESVDWSALKGCLIVTDDGSLVTEDGQVLSKELISATKRGPKFSVKVAE